MKTAFTFLLGSFLSLLLPAQSSNFNVDSLGFISFNGNFTLETFDHYLVTSQGRIYDVSAPGNPSLVASFTPPAGTVTALHYQAPYLYVGTSFPQPGNFQIVDLSFVFAPNSVGNLGLSSFDIFGLARQDNHVYLAMGNLGVVSIDVSNPAQPVSVDTLVMPNQVRAVSINGCVAIVAGDGGLTAIDISDPTNLTMLSSFGTGFRDVVLLGDTAIACGGTGAVQVVDFSAPTAPVPLAGTAFNDGGWGIDFREGIVYVSSNGGDLYAYSLDFPSLPLVAYFDGNAGQGFDVATNDSLVFLSGLVAGVHVLQLDTAVAPGNFSPGAAPCLATSFTQMEKPASWTVSPQPFRDRLRVGLPERPAFQVQVRLYDLHGRPLLETTGQPGDQLELETKRLPAGVYFLQLTYPDGHSLSKKLIRN